MQYKTLVKRLFSDIKIKYLQMMNIELLELLQTFPGTNVAERTRTHQGSFIKHWSKA